MAGEEFNFITVPKIIDPDPQRFIQEPQLLADWIYKVALEVEKIVETDLTASNGVILIGTDIQHEDTSSVSDETITGAQVLASISFDTFGHVETVTLRNLTTTDIGAEPAFTKNTAFNKNFGLITDTVLEGDTAPADIGAEPADATILKDADIGATVQAWDADLDTYSATPLTAAELGELQNINVVTITNAQWAFLGDFDQALITTSNVTFNIITAVNDINIANNKQLNFRNNADSSDLEIARVNTADQLIFGAGIATVFIRTSSTNALTFNSVQQGTFTGNIVIDDTTGSTSATSGSVQTDGGLGVVENIHGSGDLTIDSGGEVFLNLPTVSTGTSGSLWSDSGTVKVVP